MYTALLLRPREAPRSNLRADRILCQVFRGFQSGPQNYELVYKNWGLWFYGREHDDQCFLCCGFTDVNMTISVFCAVVLRT